MKSSSAERPQHTEKDVFESDKIIEKPTHPDIRRAVIKRLVDEVNKANPDPALKKKLVKASDPVMALEFLRKDLADSSQSTYFSPKVIETLILAGANYKPELEVNLERLKSLGFGLCAVFFAQEILMAGPRVPHERNPHVEGIVEAAVALAGVGMLAGASMHRPQLSAEEIAASKGITAFPIADRQAIDFLLNEVTPVLHGPVGRLEDAKLLQVLKKLPSDFDPLTRSAILGRIEDRIVFLTNTAGKEADLKKLEGGILVSGDSELVERLSYYRSSQPIARKLAEIAADSSLPDQATLLFRAGDMNYLCGDVPTGLNLLLQGADRSILDLRNADADPHLNVREKTIAVETAERCLFQCLGNITAWMTVDFANDPNELFRTVPGSKESYLKLMSQLEALDSSQFF